MNATLIGQLHPNGRFELLVDLPMNLPFPIKLYIGSVDKKPMSDAQMYAAFNESGAMSLHSFVQGMRFAERHHLEE